ncbi:hypothetical protein ACFL2B_02595 [Patescibacteria group bacterium]
MEIRVDYNPTPEDQFFISVPISDKEIISFDKTIKGHRIVKQVYREEKPFTEDTKFDAEWDVLIIKDKKFASKYHVKWIDKDQLDWLNGEIWETIWEKKMSQDLSDQLLNYSRLVSDNYQNLDSIAKQLDEFEKLLANQIEVVSGS